MPNSNFQISSPRNLNSHVRSDKGKGERAEGQESLHTTSGPIGYLGSATNLHVKLSSVIEYTHTQLNNPFFTRIVMMMMMMMMMMITTIILMVMLIITNNNFHNFNEAFSYEFIVYPRYVAMQAESVLWTAVIRRLFLSPKVQFNW
jgi:hypothetical protein